MNLHARVLWLVLLVTMAALLNSCGSSSGPPSASVPSQAGIAELADEGASDAHLEQSVSPSALSLRASASAKVTLSDTGVSTLGWPFEEASGWEPHGDGPGEEESIYHAGADAWARDWNWGSTSGADLGKPLLSCIEGIVIFASTEEERGDELGYGKQVVIRSRNGGELGTFALRYAHMNRVDVKVDDLVLPGTPLGTVGGSGRTGDSQYDPHLHLVLYKQILEETPGGQTCLTRLRVGDNPTSILPGTPPSIFAAEYELDSSARVDFSLEDAAHRLSPVLRELSGLPTTLQTGRTYDVSWRVMGYHGRMASSIVLQHEEDPQIILFDNDPELGTQGWRWGHAYSRNYLFNRQLTIPPDAPHGEYEVRFFWSRMDRGPLPGDEVAAADKTFLSVLIPGGVDGSTIGNEGRRLSRSVVGGSGTSAGSPIEPVPTTSVDPTPNEAANRLSPVLRDVTLPAVLRAGASETIEWTIMSYHNDPASMVRIEVGGEVLREYDLTPEDLGQANWSWGDVSAHEYRYRVDFPIPDKPGSQCRVRFFWGQRQYQDSRSQFLSVLIPGGVDASALGNAGRSLLRNITGQSGGGSQLPGAFRITSLASGCSDSTTRVDLSWSNASGATSYRVYRDGAATSIALPSTLTSWSDVGPSAASHTYRVEAKNSAGSTWATTKSVRVDSCTTAAPSERVTNSSFSSGSSGWTKSGDWWIGTDASHYYSSPGYAAGGVTSAGTPEDDANGWMYQPVTIPSSATQATLSFRWNVSSEETSSTTAYDVLNVTLKSAGGSCLATVLVKSNLHKTTAGSYSLATYDLSSYAGQTIRIHFWATTDSSYKTVFRIDNVSVMSDG